MGHQLEVDIHKRVKTFIEKDRVIPSKRSEFNMFLKESGIAIDVAVFKKQHASTVREENYKFAIGIGMYDFITGEYRGLDETEDAAVAFGWDLGEMKKDNAKRDEQYKKLSLEIGRDVRFPTEEQRKRRDEWSKKNRAKITFEIHQWPVLPPNWKGDPDDYIDYWSNLK